MEEKNNERKKILLVIAIFIVLIAISVGGVYAYFSARATNSGQEITGRTLDINGSTLSIVATRLNLNPSPAPVSDNLLPAKFGVDPTEMTTTQVNKALTKACVVGGYTGCHVWKITASTTQDVPTANIRLNLNVNTVTDKDEWSYVVYTGTDSSAGAVINKGLINTDFGNTTNTIDIHNGASLSNGTPAIYYVMVYLNNTNSIQNDGTAVGTTNETGTYNGSVILEAMGGEVKVNFLDDAVEYITNLYNNATKSTATVNSITYSLASSVGLMRDQFGSSSSASNTGNLRYYGADPDNYVWLGDTYTSTYTFTSNGTSITRNVGDKKLWRIIGVFDGRLKLISNDPISTQGLSWDTSVNTVNSGRGINQWGQSENYEGSDLMRLLNPGYESTSVNNSLYWNKTAGTVYTGNNNATTPNVSFANTGLSSVEKNMIDATIWYLGSQNQFNNVYVDMQYISERQNNVLGKICTQGTNYCDDEVTRTSTWNGKVGLMYLSDYGYATDLSICTNMLLGYNIYAGDGTGYDNTNCKVNNWIFNSSYWQWTLSSSANSAEADYVLNVSSFGSSETSPITNNRFVTPAVFLKSGVSISSGNGSESNPFVLE